MIWTGAPVYYHCIKSCITGKEKVFFIKHKKRNMQKFLIFLQGASEFPNTWCLLKPGSFMKNEAIPYDTKSTKTQEMECLVTYDQLKLQLLHLS